MASEPERIDRTPPVHRQRFWQEGYESGRRYSALLNIFREPFNFAALIVLFIIMMVAIFAPLFSRQSPTVVYPAERLIGPSSDHWFGTDDLGRDVFTRLIYGARISLLVGVTVMLASAIIGSTLGLIAGYYSSLDNLIMRILDGLMAFPGILLAIAIVTSLGPSAANVIIALTIVYVPVVARLLRSATLSGKQQQFVESARAVGLRDRTIIRRYIFANTTTPLIVQCTFILAYAIIAEASLSYLGASINPETPTWGNMLRDGQRLVGVAWWIAVFPGIALFITVLALNVVGDGVRDALDPRARTRHRQGTIH